ncbi:hypothetical protein Tco_1216917 [Tanacetum coccineum]
MVNDACKDSFKRFTNKPALVCLTPPKDVNDEKEKQEVKNLAEPMAKRQTRITPCLKNFKVISKESIFHSNKPLQVSLVFAITSTLPSIEPKDSLIMGDEHLNHKPQHIENESDHVTFSPKSDPLHHEFTGELITIPPGIVKKSTRIISSKCRMRIMTPIGKRTIYFPDQEDSITTRVLESDFRLEEDIINNMLMMIPFTNMSNINLRQRNHMVPVINNVDAHKEDDVSTNQGEVRLMLKLMIPSHLLLGLFFRISLTLRFLPYFPPPKMRTPFFDPATPLRAGGLSRIEPFNVALMYGYCKNLKKTVRTGQTRTWERKENTRAGRMLSKGSSSNNTEEQFADEKERKARTLLLMAVPKESSQALFSGTWIDAKEIILQPSRTRFGSKACLQASISQATAQEVIVLIPLPLPKQHQLLLLCKFKGSKEGSRQEAGRGQDFKQVQIEKEALMTIDEGQINWVEQTTDEELNHALMAFTVNNELMIGDELNCYDRFSDMAIKSNAES